MGWGGGGWNEGRAVGHSVCGYVLHLFSDIRPITDGVPYRYGLNFVAIANSYSVVICLHSYKTYTHPSMYSIMKVTECPLPLYLSFILMLESVSGSYWKRIKCK